MTILVNDSHMGPYTCTHICVCIYESIYRQGLSKILCYFDNHMCVGPWIIYVHIYGYPYMYHITNHIYVSISYVHIWVHIHAPKSYMCKSYTATYDHIPPYMNLWSLVIYIVQHMCTHTCVKFMVHIPLTTRPYDVLIRHKDWGLRSRHLRLYYM